MTHNITIDFSNLFSYNQLILIGIVLEIFGALFLSYETIGTQRLDRFFDLLKRFSNWYKKSLLRMTLLSIPYFVIFVIALFFNIKILVGLLLPSLIAVTIISMLIDHPNYYKNWLSTKSDENKLSPIGFIILACGGIIQMIGIILQMTIDLNQS